MQKRLAHARTRYALDLIKLQDFAQVVNQELLALRPCISAVSAAQMHSAGRSARGIALILSGLARLYRWAAQQDLVPFSPWKACAAPRHPNPCPKPWLWMTPMQRPAFKAEADPWIEARDAAMTELLYSCGLRVGELVSWMSGRSDHAAARPGPGSISGRRRRLCAGQGRRSAQRARGAYGAAGAAKWLALRSAVVEGCAGQARTEAALFIGRQQAARVPSLSGRGSSSVGSRPGWCRACIRMCCATLLPIHAAVSGDLRAVQGSWATPALPRKSMRDWIFSIWLGLCENARRVRQRQVRMKSPSHGARCQMLAAMRAED